MSEVADWEARGRELTVDSHRIWVLDEPATRESGRDPLLVLHGFPTCSFDWRHVHHALRADRRVVCLDFLGFGLSDKPDWRYSIRAHADTVEAVASTYGLTRVALVTHDMGDSIGGEVLARSLDGTLGFEISRRVLTNGSIYIEQANLSAGQQFLLSLDDARIDGDAGALVGGDGFKNGVAGTFSSHSNVGADEMDAQWELAARHDGHLLLARSIRYIEDRRKEERRYTGAIEKHPSPVGVVWGADDPIAIVAMTDELHAARSDAPITILDNVGHYPMIESPERFAEAVLAHL
jgi:pimeloyl-ACP methyl ester carboxylesterase